MNRSDSLQAATKYDTCKAWLRDHLADCTPHLAGGIFAAGAALGYSEQTIRRAANSLKVERSAANYGQTRRPGTCVELWSLPMKGASK
jgi:hypothetical protein